MLNQLHDELTIPGFGALTQYLVAADFSCSGAIAMPSTQEIGDVIATMQLGGLSGLRILGYLSAAGKHPKAEVVSAFEAFYQDVGGVLGLNEQRDFGWNTIVAEHTLCKVKRLHNHYKL